MYKSQKGGIITHKCNIMETRTKCKESRYMLESKPTDYQIKFGMTRGIMTRKRSINRDVVLIEVMNKSFLSILASSDILLADILLPRIITEG